MFCQSLEIEFKKKPGHMFGFWHRNGFLTKPVHMFGQSKEMDFKKCQIRTF